MNAAPYPADTRAKGWRFELDHERIRQSDTWALAAPEMRPWLLMLWMVAWEQTPCGSLPDDDSLIAARIGMQPKAFVKAKSALLRGWWLADDGRLYHDTVAEKVLGMLDTRGIDRTRQDARRLLFEKIRERDDHACVYCGHTKYLTLDHLLPLTRGGDNDERNLAIACRPCNSKKRDRTPEECGFDFMSAVARERWQEYKAFRARPRESGGEIPRNDTGTGTGTGTDVGDTVPSTGPAGVPAVNGHAAVAVAQLDQVEAVFTLGLPLLLSASVPERQARSFLGRLRKFNSDEAVLAAIDRCVKAVAASPVEFLQGCLRTNPGHHNRLKALEASNRDVAASWANKGEILDASI